MAVASRPIKDFTFAERPSQPIRLQGATTVTDAAKFPQQLAYYLGIEKKDKFDLHYLFANPVTVQAWFVLNEIRIPCKTAAPRPPQKDDLLSALADLSYTLSLDPSGQKYGESLEAASRPPVLDDTTPRGTEGHGEAVARLLFHYDKDLREYVASDQSRRDTSQDDFIYERYEKTLKGKGSGKEYDDEHHYPPVADHYALQKLPPGLRDDNTTRLPGETFLERFARLFYVLWVFKLKVVGRGYHSFWHASRRGICWGRNDLYPQWWKTSATTQNPGDLVASAVATLSNAPPTYTDIPCTVSISKKDFDKQDVQEYIDDVVKEKPRLSKFNWELPIGHPGGNKHIATFRNEIRSNFKMEDFEMDIEFIQVFAVKSDGKRERDVIYDTADPSSHKDRDAVCKFLQDEEAISAEFVVFPSLVRPPTFESQGYNETR